MFDVIRRRLTYANTIATIAVVIALGGPRTRPRRSGPDVRDGSLTAPTSRTPPSSRDIENRSLRAVDFRRACSRRPGRAAGLVAERTSRVRLAPTTERVWGGDGCISRCTTR